MNGLTDKELMMEVLDLEKCLATLYHTATQESSTEPLHCDLKNLMNDTVCKQNETYKLMQQKGLYQIQQVQQAEIDKVKNKFSQAVNQ